MAEKIKVEIKNEDFESGIVFEKRSKIYQAKVKGFFRTLKNYTAYILLSIFFVLPFLRFYRGEGVSNQAVLIDLEVRKYYFFNIEMWPQDVFYFIGILIFAAIFLFFVTSLFGRVWCGYACPQTVFSDLFYKIENFIEGSNFKRQKQDKRIWNKKVLPKKIAKHFVWLLVSFATGATICFYFNDAYETLKNILTVSASFTVYFWTALITATTYCFAGFAREYICIYACPYSRFQGAMMDEDSLVVTYDYTRGEPRGKESDKSAGECIDCNRCVAVCPVGIDIRDGQQYQCINCGLCVDACNDIMAKIDKEPNLVAYDTLRNLKRKEKGKPSEFKILRPRTIIYGIIVSLLGFALLYGILFKKQVLETSVSASRSPMFVQLANGDIRNIYKLKIVNKSNVLDSVNLQIKGIDSSKITIMPTYKANVLENAEANLKLKKNKVNTFKVFIDTASYSKKGNYEDLEFIITADNITEKLTTKFTHP